MLQRSKGGGLEVHRFHTIIPILFTSSHLQYNFIVHWTVSRALTAVQCSTKCKSFCSVLQVGASSLLWITHGQNFWNRQHGLRPGVARVVVAACSYPHIMLLIVSNAFYYIIKGSRMPPCQPVPSPAWSWLCIIFPFDLAEYCTVYLQFIHLPQYKAN